MIAAGTTTNALQRAAIAQGMAAMRDVAVARVRRGETTLQEVERVIGDQIEDQLKETGPSSILVVNADPAWRRMARALLESGGFRVTEAVDATQAMQMMNTGDEFALMVTDLMMPTLAQTSIPEKRAPSLRPTMAVPVMSIVPPTPRKSLPTQVPVMGTGTDGQATNVDWGRFTATVQSAIRKTEH
jgi:PleD family two-component response regulator